MLTVEQLAFSFPGKTVLDGVSLNLRPHAVTCLLGGNGSSKSTLLKAIYSLLPPWNTAKQGVSEADAVKKGMEEKSKEFVEKGAEVYAKM